MPQCHSLLTCLYHTILATLLCLISLTNFTSPVMADIGPELWAPGDSISPSSPTQVRMDEAYVQMDLFDSREVEPLGWQFPQCAFVVKVQADFRMKNMGDSTEGLTEQFSLPHTQQNLSHLLQRNQTAFFSEDSGWFFSAR